jgi:hypothetical protein
MSVGFLPDFVSGYTVLLWVPASTTCGFQASSLGGLTDVIAQTFHLDGQQMLMAFVSFSTLFPTWLVWACSMIYRLFGSKGLLVLALVQSCLGY